MNNIQSSSMRLEDELLLTCLQEYLHQNRCMEINKYISGKVNWNCIINKSLQHGISPLLYQSLSSHSIDIVPEAVNSELKKAYLISMVKNTQVFHQLTGLIQFLIKSGIKTVLLKGASLVYTTYSDIALRPMSDIDILIKEPDIVKLEAVLYKLNFSSPSGQYPSLIYKKLFAKFHHHLPLYVSPDGILSIEFHRHILPKIQGVDFNIDLFWQKAVPIQSDEVQSDILSNEHQLFHLCYHFYQNFKSGGIRLSWLFDIALFVQTHSNNINWNELLLFAENIGAIQFLTEPLLITSNLLNINLPNEVLKKRDEFSVQDVCNKYLKLLTEGNKDRNISENYITMLKEIKGIKNKIVYVFADTFPNREFMNKRYGIEKPRIIFVFHVKRFFRAVFRSFIALKEKILKKPF